MIKTLKSGGFSYEFDPSKCESCGGKCCIGESGYIWINAEEIATLVKFLNIEEEGLKSRYLEKFGYKFSIKEKEFEGEYACVFFNEELRNCGIYEVRPAQCRSFPFWDHFKKNLKELEKECIGVKFL